LSYPHEDRQQPLIIKDLDLLFIIFYMKEKFMKNAQSLVLPGVEGDFIENVMGTKTTLNGDKNHV